MKAELHPTTDEQQGEGWTAVSGGSAVGLESGKAAGFLSVISGFTKVVSILAIFNDPAYAKQIETFIGTLKLDKVAAPAKPAVANSGAPDGPLLIPIVTRRLTLTDLAGEWGENSGQITTAYICSSDGSYAGRNSLHYTSKMTITPKGAYKNSYFAVRNGRKESDDTAGTLKIDGRLVSIERRVTTTRTTTTRFVVIGWLDLADRTIMTVSSNFFPGNVIPETVLNSNDPHSYSTIWVRKK